MGRRASAARVLLGVAAVAAVAAAAANSHPAFSNEAVLSREALDAAAETVRARMPFRPNCSRWVPNRHQSTKGQPNCYVLPPLLPGVRPFVLHMVRKAGSTSYRQGLSDLSLKYRHEGLRGNPVGCAEREVADARAAGAFEFGVSREPLDKFLSSYHFLGRDVPENATAASTRDDLLVRYVDDHLHLNANPHAFDQAFWYCGLCRGPECGALAVVLRLEDPDEFNALFEVALAGDDEHANARRIRDDAAHFRQRHDAPLPPQTLLGAARPARRERAARADQLALLGRLPARTRAKLCAHLRVDYDLFPWYERPDACADGGAPSAPDVEPPAPDAGRVARKRAREREARAAARTGGFKTPP